MSQPETPLTFEPIFMERVWGGRRLESEYGKKLPPNTPIGESWEIVDRPEAQSVVQNGPLKGKTLHALWTQHRQAVFGTVPDGSRFPLFIKLLDAREKLSLQVHPPENVAGKVGGEPKTEFWYVAAAEPNAELLVGLREETSAQQFRQSIEKGKVADHVHSIRVKPGDAMFLPAGRFHAIGGGNLLVEIQQNSDTTYRVFDWNRVDDQGNSRQLHVDKALQCINFNDKQPQLTEPKGELLAKNPLFEIQKWNLDSVREAAAVGQFAIICCLTGSVRCGNVDLLPGQFCLIPAQLDDRQLGPQKQNTTLLRITIPV